MTIGSFFHMTFKSLGQFLKVLGLSWLF